MKVSNIHERILPVSSKKVACLIDSLSGTNDMLWPNKMWPRIKFDGPLAVGSIGGHGPIRYKIEEYAPGKSIGFKFLAPKGFIGSHYFEVVEVEAEQSVLRHVLNMEANGFAIFTWGLVIRCLHDALIEDCFAKAETSLGLKSTIKPWSLQVKVVKWFMSKGHYRSQVIT